MIDANGCHTSRITANFNSLLGPECYSEADLRQAMPIA